MAGQGCTADDMPDETRVAQDPVTPQVAEVLVANHRDFLRFVERRMAPWRAQENLS